LAGHLWSASAKVCLVVGFPVEKGGVSIPSLWNSTWGSTGAGGCRHRGDRYSRGGSRNRADATAGRTAPTARARTSGRRTPGGVGRRSAPLSVRVV